MKKKTRFSFLAVGAVAMGLLLGASAAQAALIDRGNGLIYDDVLNITWTQNANLWGQTGTWQEAVDWADQLVYQGYDDWRLASMSVAGGLPTGSARALEVVNCGTATEPNCRDNELGYMFYQNLMGMPLDNLTGDQAFFTDIQDMYWSGTESEDPLGVNDVWNFNFFNGDQGEIDKVLSLPSAAWAVHAGDVAAGPPPTSRVDLTGTVEDAGGTPLCALALASGQFMFTCNPNGSYDLQDLPRAGDGTVKRQVYVDGFFPNVETLTGSTDETVVMTRATNCTDYNAFPAPGTFPDSAGKRIDVSGTVLLQNTQTPVCAMVLGNGQFGFTCDGTGTYAANIPLDANGQYKLQVYADGFAPTVQRFDEFSPDVEVHLARAAECQ